jgi:Xaa-Pro aminopeptidase
LLDKKNLNYALYRNIPKEVKVIEGMNPEAMLKSVKNAVEIAGMEDAQARDAVALTKFMYWLKTNIGKIKITEISAAEYLDKLRSEQGDYISDSFEPLSAYADHAPQMHYQPAPETQYELRPVGFCLFDTGGNYKAGSTDITRTIALGPLTEQEKTDFTIVARAMMAGARAKFLYGLNPQNLDILVREPVWEEGLDFKCGTGHGVGNLLNIHENPPNMGYNRPCTPFEEGQYFTIEPGIYRDGFYGIRTENEVLVRKAEKNYYGQYMYFQMMTWVPIDLDAILPEKMSPAERDWLNKYHAEVYRRVSPSLTNDEKEWLNRYTRAI